MLARGTVLALTLAEGVVICLTVVVGTAVADSPEPKQSVDVAVLFARGVAFAATCVVALYLADLYDIVTLRRAAAIPQRLPRALGVWLGLVGLLHVILPDVLWNVRTFLPCAAAAIVVLIAMHVALGRIVRRSQPERVLVVGDGSLARTIVSTVEAKLHGEHVIVGVVALAGDREAQETLLDSAMQHFAPERIVVAAADQQAPLPLQQLLEGRLQGIAVEDGVLFYERLAGRIALEALTPGRVAFGDGFGEPRLHAAFAHALGLVVALFGLIALAPFLLLVALAIRLGSPGPIFFVQQRVGLRGRPYGLIKLRTMYVTEAARSEWVQDNKDRITPLGRWLRRFRIDELPQLVNVLKGDMNLVGPRPHPVSNYLLFMEKIPHYAQRSVVRPGITGWAQVRYGYANNLEQEIEKMCFDLFYIRNVSIWLDLRVLLKTVRVVLRGHEGVSVAMPPVRAELSGTVT